MGANRRSTFPATRLAGAAAILTMAVTAGGCELGLYGVEQATAGGCNAWRPGCPNVVDIADGDPIQRTRVSEDRPAIVEAAEDAPHRQCDLFPMGCQAVVIGGVVADKYFFVF